MNKLNVLFLCTGNSCRSQMAEGFAKKMYGNKINFYSAGTEKHGMNGRAIKVMSEIGIDISNHYSKTLSDLAGIHFDYVYTVCGHANENCPYFAGNAKIKHVGFEDPPKLTQAMTNEEEILIVYRKVRDEIQNFIKNLERELI